MNTKRTEDKSDNNKNCEIDIVNQNSKSMVSSNIQIIYCPSSNSSSCSALRHFSLSYAVLLHNRLSLRCRHSISLVVCRHFLGSFWRPSYSWHSSLIVFSSNMSRPASLQRSNVHHLFQKHWGNPWPSCAPYIYLSSYSEDILILL